MKLEVNKTYLVNTKKETLKNKKLKVVSIRNWKEAIQIPTGMPIIPLSINEQVIENNNKQTIAYLIKKASESEFDDPLFFFKNLVYYHCIDIESSNESNERKSFGVNYNLSDYKSYVLWDDIINFDKTTTISSTYRYETVIQIKDKIKQPLNIILEDIQRYINTKYGQDVSFDFRHIYNSSSVTQDILKIREEELEKARTIITQLNQLKIIEPILNQLLDSNLSNKLNELIDKTGDIESTVNSISALVS